MDTTQMKEVLKGMKRQFTSHEFSQACKTKGLPDGYIHNNQAPFLKENCHRVSRKVWLKLYQTELESRLKSVEYTVELNEEEMIEKAIGLLKSKGYKIMKQTFQEV